ncbi:hypothetical protein [Gordonia neofelifaecis]|uniref:ABC transporter domain-containing protein n=1 Tax=Gordonia neofelifaecis NRRL B-59395 TaxID=644548 RepID=F1YK61_9ACTN|nr:hypothetical protein [Gordonia neofelifaecis]EGD54907.1 hypothetical protein SCNU_11890 [Gordonia neofelifaecis NRRL B-59395]
MTDHPETAPDPMAVVARGLTQKGPWGQVYGPLDLDIPRGGLTILRAEPGAGRTALQMTLAGRMKPKAGSLDVFGRTRPRAIFKVASLAAVPALDDVYASVRVVDLLTEKMRWDARWFRLIGKATDEDLERICRPVFGDLPLPGLGDYVEELSELDGLLLRVALANTKQLPLLVVGNIDQVSSDDDHRILVSRLAALGAAQTVVTTTVNRVDPGLGHRALVEVPSMLTDKTFHAPGGAHAEGDI